MRLSSTIMLILGMFTFHEHIGIVNAQSEHLDSVASRFGQIRFESATSSADPLFALNPNVVAGLSPGHLEYRPSDKSDYIKVQSEHLPDPIDYQSLELRLDGCQNNLPIYFHKCIIKESPFSEAQIGKHVYRCNKEAWHKFFDCVGLYPKPTITEQIEDEIGGKP